MVAGRFELKEGFSVSVLSMVFDMVVDSSGRDTISISKVSSLRSLGCGRRNLDGWSLGHWRDVSIGMHRAGA